MNFPITYNLYPITHLLNSQTYYPLGILIEVSKEIPLNRSALHWLPEAKRMQADQKVFELTILGVCNRYLKKNDCGCRDYEKCQFPYEPSHICRADTGCRK